jgi:hypothetical protein
VLEHSNSIRASTSSVHCIQYHAKDSVSLRISIVPSGRLLQGGSLREQGAVPHKLQLVHTMGITLVLEHSIGFKLAGGRERKKEKKMKPWLCLSCASVSMP